MAATFSANVTNGHVVDMTASQALGAVNGYIGFPAAGYSDGAAVPGATLIGGTAVTIRQEADGNLATP